QTENNRFVDAAELALRLTGSASQANVLLLGVAVQDGHIPVSVESIEAAIELNAVAVQANLAALDWGRRWAHDPVAVESLVHSLPSNDNEAITTVSVPDLGPELVELVSNIDAAPELTATLLMLTADLVDFQDEDYARTFIAAVAQGASAEKNADPTSKRLTESVARSLHKLMAYKDEYEVARLMLLPEADKAAKEVGGLGATITWQLHPPILKALGRDSKTGFGPNSKPAFAALRSAKRLRGTRFDPFGRSEMRSTERVLASEFNEAMILVYSALTADNIDAAIAIAELPQDIRGFEALKMRRIGEFRKRLSEALSRF
ncbi:MAG: DUF6537 domain-containing protein, partial [Acidimicrobiales bacterium]